MVKVVGSPFSGHIGTSRTTFLHTCRCDPSPASSPSCSDTHRSHTALLCVNPETTLSCLSPRSSRPWLAAACRYGWGGGRVWMCVGEGDIFSLWKPSGSRCAPPHGHFAIAHKYMLHTWCD